MLRRTDLVLATPAQPLAELVERAQAYTVDARASSTRKRDILEDAASVASRIRAALPHRRPCVPAYAKPQAPTRLA
jgi:hypothetical protein